MRREVKSLGIGVHHADAVVWEPVYRTRLLRGLADGDGERDPLRHADGREHRTGGAEGRSIRAMISGWSS